ncbi:uncharacterized protein VP01_540g4 [Puccinia sorghi]|uniref:Uncharacterized protein n=1 Tax=Puccinia sorghi TaxID=27349 RepID=A0A0L6UJR8_9BASI|nr:uncharacterized protein VP01_540g4 [Puccinia sorghi]
MAEIKKNNKKHGGRTTSSFVPASHHHISTQLVTTVVFKFIFYQGIPSKIIMGFLNFCLYFEYRKPYELSSTSTPCISKLWFSQSISRPSRISPFNAPSTSLINCNLTLHQICKIIQMDDQSFSTATGCDHHLANNNPVEHFFFVSLHVLMPPIIIGNQNSSKSFFSLDIFTRSSGLPDLPRGLATHLECWMLTTGQPENLQGTKSEPRHDLSQKILIVPHIHTQNRLAICPHGGNTGLVSGSIPVFDEVILNLGAQQDSTF